MNQGRRHRLFSVFPNENGTFNYWMVWFCLVCFHCIRAPHYVVHNNCERKLLSLLCWRRSTFQAIGIKWKDFMTISNAFNQLKREIWFWLHYANYFWSSFTTDMSVYYLWCFIVSFSPASMLTSTKMLLVASSLQNDSCGHIQLIDVAVADSLHFGVYVRIDSIFFDRQKVTPCLRNQGSWRSF